MPEIRFLAALAARIRNRLRQMRADPERGGFTTETVIVTALLVALAVAALGVITTKVLDKANNLNL